MADGASVGVISLDLVIKNKVQEQLDKISASIQNGFSKPVEQAEKAVENAMDKTAKAIDEGFGSASEIDRNKSGILSIPTGLCRLYMQRSASF